MNKKSIIVCISALLLLALLVVGAVTVLYSGKKPDTAMSETEAFDKASSRLPMLCAVPSDAAMVLYGKSLKSLVSAMGDSTYFIGSLFLGSSGNSFSKFITETGKMLGDGEINSIKGSSAAISMHYSGTLAPLLIIDSGKMPKDSTSGIWKLFELADTLGVSHAVVNSGDDSAPALKRKVLSVFSPAESLVHSSERNVSGNTSVLNSDACARLAASATSDLSIFVNNEYSTKLSASFLSGQYRKYASFFKNYAEWSLLGICDMDDRSLSLEGYAESVSSPAYFSNIYGNIRPGTAQYMSVLPSGTLEALSLQTSDAVSYVREYGKYLDATGKIKNNRAESQRLEKECGIAPQTWAKSLDVKEVVRAAISGNDGVTSLLLIRPGNRDLSIIFRGLDYKKLRDYDGGVRKYQYRGFASNLFGSAFSIADSAFVFVNDWIVVGTENALESFVQSSGKDNKKLADALSEAGLSDMIKNDGSSVQYYYAADVNPESLKNAVSKTLGKSVPYLLDGVSYCPFVLYVTPGETPKIEARVARAKYDGSADNAPAMSKDTTVTIPEGPFTVTDCSTGKKKLFSQQSNNYLVLKELDGKGIWGVPFQSHICGAVSEIDYFGNGKLQFLFASGSKLYLIDRLGRFVKPFPVEIGKEILLGPAAYDFTGAHGYTVQVLHPDNTIGMYDLHGNPVASWKGITSDETIKSLPELLKVKGKRYWVVRTSVRTLVFGADGGKPVLNPSGNKTIRPDAQLKPNEDGTVSALCYDGKERSLKL